MLNKIFIFRYLYSCFRNKPDYYRNVNSFSLNFPPRNKQLIVSLTSFPARIKVVSFTIESILNQSTKPDRVILCLAYSQFPAKEKNLPKRLLRLKQFGLDIIWYDDIRSYKKLIPVLKMFPKDIIVTADDDVYYPPNWLGLLYNSYLKDPSSIHCHRGHTIKVDENSNILPYEKWGNEMAKTGMANYNILMTGVGGVLYPPSTLCPDVFDESYFMEFVKDADDIWFWAMAVNNGTKIKVVDSSIVDFDPVFNPYQTSLWSTNCMGNNNFSISNVCSKFPMVKQRLITEI